MSKKIDERIPRELGEGVLPMHAAIKSPWDKLMSYHDAAHYVQRYQGVISAAIMQAFRILVPDYVDRSKAICKNAYNRLAFLNRIPGVAAYQTTENNTHPFCAGNFPGAMIGDAGDECLLMCGRVNDFGTYRAEKELDVCYWDIVGSELCRSTTQSLQACADVQAELRRKGPRLEFHMVEAKGCGDRHCRIVAESREKYPMPEHEQWECFGPVATADQIKYTKEEDTVKESMIFREECGYRFTNGTNWERDPKSSVYPLASTSNGACYILPTLDDLVREGTLDADEVTRVLKCVCEAAGKAAFGDFYAREGLRSWLGVPREIDDGRVVGAYIEMYLQSARIPYDIEAFNKDEVVYTIDRMALSNRLNRMIDTYLAYWYGATKTLVSAEWSLWEDAEGCPEDKVRVRIAKKIDKFC
jgi:hypothetical protein